MKQGKVMQWILLPILNTSSAAVSLIVCVGRLQKLQHTLVKICVFVCREGDESRLGEVCEDFLEPPTFVAEAATSYLNTKHRTHRCWPQGLAHTVDSGGVPSSLDQMESDPPAVTATSPLTIDNDKQVSLGDSAALETVL